MVPPQSSILCLGGTSSASSVDRNVIINAHIALFMRNGITLIDLSLRTPVKTDVDSPSRLIECGLDLRRAEDTLPFSVFFASRA